MMKNKYVKYAGNSSQLVWLMLTVIVASFASCNNFLDKGPLDVLSQKNYWQTAAQLDLYITGKYSWLPENNFYADDQSDNMLSTASRWSRYMDGQTVTPTTAGSGGWSWGRVYEINYFFDNYQKCKEPFVKWRQTLGEACFLKALIYHNLVKSFGDVPWYSHVINSDDQAELTKKRDSRAVVMDSVMFLIDKSIRLLDTRAKVGVNRINKETALIYKSRVALFEASWAKYHAGAPSASTVDASKYFQKAIDAYTELKTMSGNIGGMLYNTGNIEKDYFNLFNRENYAGINEVTLSRTYSNNITGASGNGINFWTVFGYSGRGYTKSLVQSFLDREGRTIDIADNNLFPRRGATCITDLRARLDRRFAQSVFAPGDPFSNVNPRPGVPYTVCIKLGGNYFDATGSGYWPKKGNNPDIDWNNIAGNLTTSSICFRVSEIMLNYAEAYAELHNNLPDLTDNIDKIRARVGMPPLTGHLPAVDATWPNYGYSISDVLAIVRNERNTELFGEGFRTDDWKRWRAHALFSSSAARPRGFKFDPADYSATENKTYLQQLDDQGYYDPWKTTLANGFKFRPEKDYLSPIPMEDITRSNKSLTQNPGWDTP